MSDASQVDRIVREVVGALGPVTILVNNAALTRVHGPWTEIDENGWDQVMANNAKSCWLRCRAVHPHMVEAGWGGSSDGYTREACRSLLWLGAQIRAAIPEGATDTLVTKILLGVFGSVTAFDANFRSGFGAHSFAEAALLRIGRFCRDNTEVIERHRVPTLDFETGAASARRYTRAKCEWAMVFFAEGAPSS